MCGVMLVSSSYNLLPQDLSDIQASKPRENPKVSGSNISN